jgi:UDP-glucose 4-epimerase
MPQQMMAGFIACLAATTPDLERIAMRKIVIFGASGFVGSALVAQLARNNIAYAAPSSASINLTESASVPAIHALVNDGDTVVMLCAYTPEKGDPLLLTPRNIAMVEHLVAGLVGRDVAQVIYVSSDAVYPMHADAVDEQTPTSPYDLYGQMHVMREQYLRRAIAPENLAILRPCAIYGEGDTHHSYGINRFIRSALAQGEIKLFGGGEEFRDHLHVDDFVRIILAAIQRPMMGILNIASGRAMRFSAIASCIQSHAVAPHAVRIVQAPRATAITHRHFNITQLLRQFPQRRPRFIDDGIRQLLADISGRA